MIKIKSFEDLQQLHKKAKANLGKQEAKVQVKVHLGSCGIASGANSIIDAFSREISKQKLPGIVVQKAACIGLCDIEPVVTVLVPGKEKVIYYNITEDKVKSIIDDHLVQGKPVRDWALDLNSPRIKLQEIRVLHNQDLDPMN
ncbi:MAG: (2Fe-2S) ferredoxin domain-containing protein, partial [Chloroflexi bacterium]|nr:(2Fe-2S) ferredoxin domain-containing protein [Chloroflexota bacterium]